MKICKICGTDNPAQFYETQNSNYCKFHHLEKYFAPGRVRLLDAKLVRGGCSDCNLLVTPENSVCFDFDHMSSKLTNISKMTTSTNERFEAEIAKCELRCSNCHRMRTKSQAYVHPSPGRPRRNVLVWAPIG